MGVDLPLFGDITGDRLQMDPKKLLTYTNMEKSEIFPVENQDFQTCENS